MMLVSGVNEKERIKQPPLMAVFFVVTRLFCIVRNSKYNVSNCIMKNAENALNA